MEYSEIFVKAVSLILSLSILVLLHEAGHFIPARLFKTKVEKFYLFFDPWFSLFKFKRGETEYGIGWLPFGGYVKIAGMIDESMDTEQLAGPPQAWEFRSKPAWQRLIIMLGGVTVNFILAFIIYIGTTFFYGEKYINNSEVKDGVWVQNTELEKAGIKTGDKLVAIDDSSSNQIAVVIIPTLDGYPKEEYANKLLRDWGIGGKKNNGILLLIAINDRQMWIEVGYGLEGALPDITCNNIIENLVVQLSTDSFNPELNFKCAVEYEKLNQTASAVSFYLRAAEYGVGSHKDITYASLLKIFFDFYFFIPKISLFV